MFKYFLLLKNIHPWKILGFATQHIGSAKISLLSFEIQLWFVTDSWPKLAYILIEKNNLAPIGAGWTARRRRRDQAKVKH